MAKKAKIEHYRPSSGSEQVWFESEFCDKCAKDDAENKIDCPIIIKFLLDEQPEEWQEINGIPTCTAFQTHEQSKQEKKRKQHEDLKDHGQTYF